MVETGEADKIAGNDQTSKKYELSHFMFYLALPINSFRLSQTNWCIQLLYVSGGKTSQ